MGSHSIANEARGCEVLVSATSVPDTVLLIDDDSATLDTFLELIRIRLPHISIETCSLAGQALERLSRADYGAVLADIGMPGMSGPTLLGYAQKLRPCLPILLATGLRDTRLAKQAMTVGAFDFIFKPIDRQDVIGSVCSALEYHELGHSHYKQQRKLLAIGHRLKRLDGLVERHECNGRAGFECIKATVGKVLRHTQAAVRMHQAAYLSSRHLMAKTKARLDMIREDTRRRAFERLKSP